MKKYSLKIFLFIMILLFTPKVFADTNVTNSIKATSSASGGTYYFSGVDSEGMAYSGGANVGTRYTGKVSEIHFLIPNSAFDFDLDKLYTITINMATEDWRNNFMGPFIKPANSDGSIQTQYSNWYVSGSFKFVSYKKIKFNVRPKGNIGPYTYVRVYSTNVSNTYITGVNNWALSSVYVARVTSSTPTPAPVTPAPTPTPQPNNQDIINNQNANTNSIINNQNQNTQDIIDNQTENSSDIIENANQNTDTLNESLNDNCKNTKLVLSNELGNSSGKYLNTSGSQVSLNQTNITRDIKLRPNTEYHLRKLTGGSTPSGMAFCLYNVNGGLSRCLEYPNLDNFNLTFTPTNYEVYARFTMYSYRVFQLEGYICNDWEREGLQSVADSINGVNNSINNSNVDSGVGNDFFSGFNDNQHGLTSIITAPLTAIQSITSSTCSPLVVPIPFTNGNVSLPCMTEIYQNNIPSVYNIWKVVSFGIIAYFICIDIFHIVKGFKDPESDKVEVLDL